MSYGAGHRSGLDLALLWLWYRAGTTAPIQLLAWETPYAAGVALKRPKKKKKKNQEQKGLKEKSNNVNDVFFTST